MYRKQSTIYKISKVMMKLTVKFQYVKINN